MVGALSKVIKFDRSQRRLLDDTARVQVVNWHRQKGKDFCAAAKAVYSALKHKQPWYIVSLTQRQADETFEKCLRFAKAFKLLMKATAEHALSSEQFSEFDELLQRELSWTAREIRFPGGGKVVSLPGRNPDTLAGFTGNIILTEFGLFPNGGYEHWSVLFPIITRGQYRVIAISTPRGKNTKFYELFSDPESYSVHECDIYQSVHDEGYQLYDAQGEPFDQSTHELQERAIAQFRRLYSDEAKWAREYECQFTGDLEALITYAQLQAAGNLGRDLPFDLLRIESDNAAAFTPQFFKDAQSMSGRLELGWDVARTGHLSSLWCNHAVPGKPKHLRYLALMHKTTFALQREVVRAAMNGGTPGSALAVGAGDSTGLGMDSNETLQAEFGAQRWLPLNFGGKGKSELGSIGATAFDGASQAIPPLDGAEGFIGMDLAALHADRSSGTVRLDESDNPLLSESHCDIAYSCLLALKAGNLQSVAPRVSYV